MNRSEIQSILTTSAIYLNHEACHASPEVGRKLLQAATDACHYLLSDRPMDQPDPPLAEARYRVTGDHGMFRRQDRLARTKDEADKIVERLKLLGFECKVSFVEKPRDDSSVKLYRKAIMEYEIIGTWWTHFMPPFLHALVAKHMAFKVRRKYTRFLTHQLMKLNFQPPVPETPTTPTSDQPAQT